MKILIVDDSKYQRYLIELVLSEYGECVHAQDGQEAVDIFAASLEPGQTRFDLVVMDILMPVMDGHASLKTICSLQTEKGFSEEEVSKAIMLSSLDDPSSMMEAQYESGASCYITKPFEKNTLLEALRSLELIDNPVDLSQS